MTKLRRTMTKKVELLPQSRIIDPQEGVVME